MENSKIFATLWQSETEKNLDLFFIKLFRFEQSRSTLRSLFGSLPIGFDVHRRKFSRLLWESFNQLLENANGEKKYENALRKFSSDSFCFSFRKLTSSAKFIDFNRRRLKSNTIRGFAPICSTKHVFSAKINVTFYRWDLNHERHASAWATLVYKRRKSNSFDNISFHFFSFLVLFREKTNLFNLGFFSY